MNSTAGINELFLERCTSHFFQDLLDQINGLLLIIFLRHLDKSDEEFFCLLLCEKEQLVAIEDEIETVTLVFQLSNAGGSNMAYHLSFLGCCFQSL